VIRINLLGDKNLIEKAIEFVHSYGMKQLEVQNEIENSYYACRALDDSLSSKVLKTE
jgi:hypothetical protein